VVAPDRHPTQVSRAVVRVAVRRGRTPDGPTHATKNGVRYRYYVSQPHLRGLARSSSVAVARVPAVEIEAVVVMALAAHLGGRTINQDLADRSKIIAHVTHIEAQKNQLTIRLKRSDADGKLRIGPTMSIKTPRALRSN
jgi:hypothetical protein